MRLASFGRPRRSHHVVRPASLDLQLRAQDQSCTDQVVRRDALDANHDWYKAAVEALKAAKETADPAGGEAAENERNALLLFKSDGHGYSAPFQVGGAISRERPGMDDERLTRAVST